MAAVAGRSTGSLGVMDSEAQRQLVSAWIDHHAHPMAWDSSMVLRRQSLHPDAVEIIDGLSLSDPDLCWDLLIQIVHSSQNDEVMMGAAGLLHRLLESYPERVIERVETTARGDPQLKELLGWLLPLDPSTELWQRVKRVAGSVEW